MSPLSLKCLAHEDHLNSLIVLQVIGLTWLCTDLHQEQRWQQIHYRLPSVRPDWDLGRLQRRTCPLLGHVFWQGWSVSCGREGGNYYIYSDKQYIFVVALILLLIYPREAVVAPEVSFSDQPLCVLLGQYVLLSFPLACTTEATLGHGTWASSWFMRNSLILIKQICLAKCLRT